jgi:arginyl-tRNA synthetase
MSLEEMLLPIISETLSELYGSVPEDQIQLQKTRPDFDGDITLVVFPFLKVSKKSPEQTGEEIAQSLSKKLDLIVGFNTVKGFLNFEIADRYWLKRLEIISHDENFGVASSEKELIMVEFSSPNTNKPLHLGHLRNIFLGDSVSTILKNSGYKTVNTQIINDRGIHICKSMLAWQRFGNEETPASANLKGDKLVGKYYVAFDRALGEERTQLLDSWDKNNSQGTEEPVHTEYLNLLSKISEAKDEKAKKAGEGKLKEFMNNQTAIMKDVKMMLLQWEEKDLVVYELWNKMNGWVYDGFESTYKAMGVCFDKLYYESETFITGKELVDKGLKDGVFYTKDDGSVWIDLSAEGLDEKLVLRSDGTAVYMTQDIGTAYQRFKDYPELGGMVYTVGNEQDYHFKVLFLILQKLGFEWAQNCYHLSYGMVDLPSGKMKSREGTVVDADELMDEVIQKAKEMTQERGHIEGMSEEEKENLYRIIGMGGLKYYLLKVDPKKRMLFNPEESVDLSGNTGPFIQYAHARIASLMRKAETLSELDLKVSLHPSERTLIKQLNEYPEVLNEASTNYSPALICNYTYELVKMYNSFYQSVSIFKEDDTAKKNMRLILSQSVGRLIKASMAQLGISVPERM